VECRKGQLAAWASAGSWEETGRTGRRGGLGLVVDGGRLAWPTNGGLVGGDGRGSRSVDE